MKYKSWLILAVLLTVALFACNGKDSESSKKEKNFDKDASYALGMNIASGLTEDGIILYTDEFIRGFSDYLNGKKLRFDEYEAIEKLEASYEPIRMQKEADYYAMMEEMMGEWGAEVKQEGIDFLNENSKRPGVITTASGLQYEVIKEGNGQRPTAEDFISVHYEGRLIDGTVFDSSENGEPLEIALFRVIPGWIEGLQLMSVGSKYRFYIPQELGYGVRGTDSIPPFAALIFEVELLDIINF